MGASLFALAKYLYYKWIFNLTYVLLIKKPMLHGITEQHISLKLIWNKKCPNFGSFDL